MTTREAFEALISAPPFEMPIERFDDRSAWPGSYTELEVDLAWQAWKAAKATCPAWHDAPTVPGVWLCTDGMSHTFNASMVRDYKPLFECRWYGPILEDK